MFPRIPVHSVSCASFPFTGTEKIAKVLYVAVRIIPDARQSFDSMNRRQTDNPIPGLPDPIEAPSPFFRQAGLAFLTAVFVATPFALDFRLVEPTLGQRFVFMIAAFGGAIVYSAYRLLRPAPPRISDPLRPWILLYTAALALSSLFSQDTGYSAAGALFPLAGLAFYMLAFAYPWGRPSVANLAGLLSLGVFAASVYGIAQAFGWEILPYAETDRAGKMKIISVFGHPNFAASYLGPALLLVATQRLWAPKPLRPSARQALAVGAFSAALLMCMSCRLPLPAMIAIPAAAAVAALAWRLGWFIELSVLATAACLILAGARGAWIAMAVAGCAAGVIYLWQQKWRLRVWLQIALACATLAAIAVLATIFTPLGGHLRARLTDSQPIASRLYTFTIAVEMVKQKPLLGWGYGAFDSGRYLEQTAAFQERPEARAFDEFLMVVGGRPAGEVHNELLEVAVDCGLLGVFALLGMGLAMLRSGWRALRAVADRQRAALLLSVWLALGCVVIDGLFSFPLRLPCSAMLFWGFLGIASRLATDYNANAADQGPALR